MGLPRLQISFMEKANTVIKRSGRGVVALILKDDTPLEKTIIYNKVEDVIKEDFTTENYDYIVNAFKGTPSKVIVEVIGTVEEVGVALDRLKTVRFNYLAMPDAEVLDNEAIATFIKANNKDNNKTFKAVLANEAADNESIINFTTDEIETEGKTYTAAEFTSRIAGILAGLSLERSSTYFVLDEVLSVKHIADEDAAVDNGELILIDDGEKIKIGRGVNSLTTTTDVKGDAFKKIKIIEGIHLVKEDIKTSFQDDYVGKYINDYDNKVLFTTTINTYFRELNKESVLDKSYENKANIDLDSQLAYIESKGVDTEDMTEQTIKEYNTGSNVFVRANVKFVDAMEGLDFNIFM